MSRGALAALAIATVAVGAVVALLTVRTSPESPPAPVPPPDVTPSDSSSDAAEPSPGVIQVTDDPMGSPSVGPPNAPVTIIEYGSFRDGDSRRSRPAIDAVRAAHADEIRWVWKTLPAVGDEADERAARAALAAGRQGRFLAMFEALVRHPGALAEDDILGYARGAGLDLERFVRDRDGDAVTKTLTTERAAAAALHVDKAPVLFLNGRPLAGQQTATGLRKEVAEALEAAYAARNKGVADADLAAYLARVRHPAGERFVAIMLRGEPPSELELRRASGASAVDDETWAVPVSSGDPQLGADDALVTLVAFGDLDNRFTRALWPSLERLHETFSANDLRIVWKHLPMASHEQSHLAAEVSVVAAGAGRFWDFVDRTLSASSPLSRETLGEFARALKLDPAAVSEALARTDSGPRVARDRDLASSLDVRAAPTVFVNGRRVIGAQPFTLYEAVVREELEKARALVSEGLSPGLVYRHILLKARKGR